MQASISSITAPTAELEYDFVVAPLADPKQIASP
jgi:hypothetical protein